MRTVFVSGLGREVSALGFGCASLGSRFSEAQGLRALHHAFERGISWYDVAPAYGDGEAEGIFGKILERPPGQGGDLYEVRSSEAGGYAVDAPSQARGARHGEGASTLGQQKGQDEADMNKDRLHAEHIEASVVESLRRLRTDYIDVLALDDPNPQDCLNEAVLHELRRIIQKGYVRCVAIAGTPEAIIAGGRAPDVYKIAQLPDNPFSQMVVRVKDALASDAKLFFVTHSVFGAGAHERLSHLLVGDGGRLGSLASQLAYNPPFMASEMLLDYAFATNPEGVVLASMFNQAHIDMNCARAARKPRSDISPFMQKFVIGVTP